MADNPLPIRSLLLFSAPLTPQNYGSPSYSSQQPFQRSDYMQTWWIQHKWTAQKVQDPSQKRRVRWGWQVQGRGKCQGWTRGWEGCQMSQERPVSLFFYVFLLFFNFFFLFFFSFFFFSSYFTNVVYFTHRKTTLAKNKEVVALQGANHPLPR